MSNIFIRTSIAPYRIDTYNSLHDRLDMKMCFYRRISMDQAFDPEAIESRCKFTPCYLKGFETGRESRKICFGIWKLLSEEKPDIVIVPEFQFILFQVLVYKWLFRKHFKVVSMTDDSYDMIAHGNDFTRLHRILRSISAPRLDDLIVVTPDVERWYQSKYRKGLWLPIIRNEEIMTSRYESLIPLSSALADKYCLNGKKILLYVGRLVKLKNLSRLIESFVSLDTDAILVIVGDGPERKELEFQAKESGSRILFPGRFDGDELYAWYNLADVCILPSYQESFGAVVNEGLLAGARYIVSTKAGASCLIDESNGELIDPFDVAGMSEAISRQLSKCSQRDVIAPRPGLMKISLEERMDFLVDRLKYGRSAE